MKHNLKVTAILIIMFIVTQLIWLWVVNHYLQDGNGLPYGMEPPEIEQEDGSIILKQGKKIWDDKHQKCTVCFEMLTWGAFKPFKSGLNNRKSVCKDCEETPKYKRLGGQLSKPSFEKHLNKFFELTFSLYNRNSSLNLDVYRLWKDYIEDDLSNPPSYEKLVGDLPGAYSRRINIQHRLVYQILKDIKTVKVIRMWTHYE